MKLIRGVLCALVLVAACSPGPAFSDLVLCRSPAASGSPGEGSLPALVDRSDVIVRAIVLRTERTNTAGNYDDQGARRVTLRTIETAKGAAPEEFVVLDGPCPTLTAVQGESLIALLEADPGGAGLQPIGLPTSVLRATASRTLAQLMTEIVAIRPLDGDARALLERNGWTVTAKRDVTEFDLPPSSAFSLAGTEIRGAAPAVTEPFERYAMLSAEVGLDLRSYAGHRAELLTFWLDRKPPEYSAGAPFGHVLIAERTLVGAWVTTFPEGGPFSLRERAAALTAPNARRSFPPNNRAPAGINIAQAYALAGTRSIAFKTGAGGNGEIKDLSRIRAFVDALNADLPTTQAVRPPASLPTTYYLHFDTGTRSLSMEYDAQDGTLTVAADGFAVRPSQSFAALIADVR